MAEFPEYESHDALGLAALVRRREVTAAELLEAAFARVDAANAAINAVVLEQRDRAMTRARSAALGGPFAGVPMLLKDLGCEAIDFPSNCGSRFFAGKVFPGYPTFIPGAQSRAQARMPPCRLSTFSRPPLMRTASASAAPWPSAPSAPRPSGLTAPWPLSREPC